MRVEEAIAAGDLEALKNCIIRLEGPALAHVHPPNILDHQDLAARCGHVHILEWFREEGLGHFSEINCSQRHSWGFYCSICENAAAGGHINVLEWAEYNGCLFDVATLSAAAGKGNRPVLEWLKAWVEKRGYRGLDTWLYGQMYTDQVYKYAVYGATGEPVLTLEDVATRQNIYQHFKTSRMIDTLEFLRCNMGGSLGGAFRAACVTGSLLALEWCHLHQAIEEHHQTLGYELAASNGNLEVIKWLRKMNYEWCDTTIREAVNSGSKDVFIYAYENGCPTSSYFLRVGESMFGGSYPATRAVDLVDLAEKCGQMAIK